MCDVRAQHTRAGVSHAHHLNAQPGAPETCQHACQAVITSSDSPAARGSEVSTAARLSAPEARGRPPPLQREYRRADSSHARQGCSWSSSTLNSACASSKTTWSRAHDGASKAETRPTELKSTQKDNLFPNAQDDAQLENGAARNAVRLVALELGLPPTWWTPLSNLSPRARSEPRRRADWGHRTSRSWSGRPPLPPRRVAQSPSCRSCPSQHGLT